MSTDLLRSESTRSAELRDASQALDLRLLELWFLCHDGSDVEDRMTFTSPEQPTNGSTDTELVSVM